MAKTQKSAELAIIPTDGGDCDMSLAGSGDYLRRVKLAAELTSEVKSKEAAVGDFLIQGVSNLGPSVAVVVVKARPHALQLTNGSSKVGGESYNMADPLFQKIRAAKDANPGQQEPNNMYGYDYLLWLPEEKTFVTYFLCKMSLFKSVPKFTANIGKHCVMTAATNNSKQNSKITYLTPTLAVAEDQDYEAPSKEEFERAMRLFTNPRVQTAGSDAEAAKGASPKGKAPKAGGRKGR